MSFSPSTTIYLCNVPFDNTNKNQIYFKDLVEQQTYFKGKAVKSFSNYLTVRKTDENGNLRNSIRVNESIQVLQSSCNYMMYQNAQHGTKYFYAFITQFIYVNEETTELVYEADVFQTWMFDVELLPSYVVREHSKTDKIGENVVPEKFNVQDFEYVELKDDNTLKLWGYLVATTERLGTDGARGKAMSGIYQGLYFYYYEKESNLNQFLDAIENEGGDCVVFIAVIPQFSVRSLLNKNDAGEYIEGYVNGSEEPLSHTYTFDITAQSNSFGKYKPLNNKLYTSPYENLIVTNHSGEQATYNIEDFVSRDNVKFIIYGDVSANPSLTLIPFNYKGITRNYDSGISISGFPQCAFNTDTFKLWLAKNQYGIALDTVGNVGQIVSGVATGIATGGAGLAIGGTQVVSGVQGILNTVNTVYQASKEPNKAHSGSARTNLLTAMKLNKFDFYIQRIKECHARTIDDFFTMYGYQTNRIKVPNISSRPFFNYVETIDINIKGSIPSDDMRKLKNIYNSGVTIWKHTAVIGDYSQDNQPT